MVHQARLGLILLGGFLASSAARAELLHLHTVPLPQQIEATRSLTGQFFVHAGVATRSTMPVQRMTEAESACLARQVAALRESRLEPFNSVEIIIPRETGLTQSHVRECQLDYEIELNLAISKDGKECHILGPTEITTFTRRALAGRTRSERSAIASLSRDVDRILGFEAKMAEPAVNLYHAVLEELDPSNETGEYALHSSLKQVGLYNKLFPQGFVGYMKELFGQDATPQPTPTAKPSSDASGVAR